ncbi:hypothetical protein MMC34_004009 [Xylographa carneopallida]|nr:hypothetical protein [Xylographa carneopallida]
MSAPITREQPQRQSLMFQQFPDEILLDIFRCLDKSSIKMVRLICQNWAFLPIRLLFDRVFISYHTPDLDVFMQITDHPVINACITELVVCVSRFKKLSGIDDYVDELWEHLEILGYLLPDPHSESVTSSDTDLKKKILALEYFGGIEVDDDITKNELSEYKVVRKGYLRYFEVYLEQESNRHNLELQMRLCMRLKSLSRLSSVRFLDEWCLDNNSSLKSDARPSLPYYKTGSPLFRSWHPLYLSPSSDEVDTCMEFFHMVHALNLARTKIKSLSTFKLSLDTSNGYDMLSQTAAKDVIFFSGLEKFYLHVSMREPVQYLIPGLPTLLQSMTRLKDLTIDLNYIIDAHEDPTVYCLKQVFCSPATILPQLTKLHLACMRCVSSDLTAWLRCQPKLEDLDLYGIELIAGNWPTTFDHMHQFLRLRSLTIGEVYHYTAGSRYWELGFRSSKDLDRAVQEFVLHGGKNPLRECNHIPVEG